MSIENGENDLALLIFEKDNTDAIFPFRLNAEVLEKEIITKIKFANFNPFTDIQKIVHSKLPIFKNTE